MTCIVGLVADCEVWMGGDSFCEKGAIVYSRESPKVFFRDHIDSGLRLLIGSAGDGIVSQILEHEIEIPPCPDGYDGRRYIGQVFGQVATDAIAARMRLLKKKAWPSFTILIGYEGNLYTIDHHCYVLHEDAGMLAIGWGEELAMGALEATPELQPDERIRRALEISSKRTSKVAPPFHILKLCKITES